MWNTKKNLSSIASISLKSQSLVVRDVIKLYFRKRLSQLKPYILFIVTLPKTFFFFDTYICCVFIFNFHICSLQIVLPYEIRRKENVGYRHENCFKVSRKLEVKLYTAWWTHDQSCLLLSELIQLVPIRNLCNWT